MLFILLNTVTQQRGLIYLPVPHGCLTPLEKKNLLIGKKNHLSKGGEWQVSHLEQLDIFYIRT